MEVFPNFEKVTSTQIHLYLKAVFGDDAVDRYTVNRWTVKLRDCEPKKVIIIDKNKQKMSDHCHRL